MKKWFAQFIHEFKEIKSSQKELREFGIVMGVFFLLLTGLSWWKGKNFLPYLSIAGIFLVLTYLNAKILKPLQKIWMGFAVIMGYFMTRIILTLLYFIALTPISIIARISGKHFLDLQYDKNATTYWLQKPTEEIPKEHYERQF